VTVKQLKNYMEQIIQTILAQAGSAQFASLTYRSKSRNELARFNVTIGANYHSLVERSKLALELLPISELVEKGVAAELAEKAKQNILASLTKTLEAHARGEQNSDYNKIGLYSPIGTNGLNLNLNDNSIQFFCLVNSKVVLEPATKFVNSRPLTIAQNKIKKLLPIGKFREFALDLANVKSVRIDGQTLVID